MHSMHNNIATLTLAAGLLIASGTALANMLTLPPEKVPDYWVWEPGPSSAEVWAPNSGLNLDKPGCASVSYFIGSDGKPHDVKLEKLVPQSDLGPTAVSVVQNFRYHAGPANPGQRAVRTYYTMQFNMRDLSDEKKAELTAACTLPGYE